MRSVRMDVFLNRLEEMLHEVESVENHLVIKLEEERREQEDKLINEIDKLETEVAYIENSLYYRKTS